MLATMATKRRTLLVTVATTVVLATTSVARGQQFEIVEATIADLQAAMASGEVSSADLVDAYLARIAAYDDNGPRLNAILRVNPRAREEAAALDRERRERGPRGPLHGIPIILKDNYDTADMPTTGGSVALAGLFPARDGFQVRRLREAGAVILAKSNLHELAMGITTVSSLGGQTLNPYDPSRNPGGSSGGTGAAVAASFAAAGMGSDTCGSIRIPASHNNLAGLRPTKGLSSIAGILPLSHTQDVGGPLARTAADLAAVLDATAGPDPDDPATAILEDNELSSFAAALDGASLDGVRLGKLVELFEDDSAEAGVVRVVDEALAELTAAGAEIVDVTVPGLSALTSRAAVINYEFKHDFIDYLQANPGAPVASLADILEQGLYYAGLEGRFRLRERVGTRDGDDYLAALEWRTILRDAVIQAMDDAGVEALLYPTMLARPSRIGEPQEGSNCSLAPNSGLPAISVPAGFTDDLLPIGLELLGRPLSDPRLVSFAHAFEQATHHRRAPALTPPLVNGAAPAPISFETLARPDGADEATLPAARARFTFDPTTNGLAYVVEFLELPADQAFGVTLHAGDSGDGPAVARLAAPGQTRAERTLQLTPVQRRALEEGTLHLRAFSRPDPAGTARGRLQLGGG
jgi:Asp-tRNA(Asn)/Glu-tRNA(Gln) amidotransferase A subunit family amidase